MAEEMVARGYSFPYLIDEDQTVARAFDAACTPDFFLYDRPKAGLPRSIRRNPPWRRRGPRRSGMCDRGGSGGASGAREQHASLGCNIKWKPEADCGLIPGPLAIQGERNGRATCGRGRLRRGGRDSNPQPPA